MYLHYRVKFNIVANPLPFLPTASLKANYDTRTNCRMYHSSCTIGHPLVHLDQLTLPVVLRVYILTC